MGDHAEREREEKIKKIFLGARRKILGAWGRAGARGRGHDFRRTEETL